MLELGCGWGDFIGQIQASGKTALDGNASFSSCVEGYGGIEFHHGDVHKVLPALPTGAYDVVFASNFFEHFAIEDVKRILAEARRVLTAGGRLIVVQPNYRLCSAAYFDDYTHRTPFSHVSFGDLAAASGFNVEAVEPRFLPFSMKSRLPVHPLLVRLYLNLPLPRPLAAQFLLVCRKKSE